MQRNDRQQKILEIISRKEIDTQEELCAELNKLNFNVTQATISRDVNDLRLYKVAGVSKKYRYVCIEDMDTESGTVSGKMKNLFRECVISLNYANNLIVIKTMRGNGNTAGAFVDSLEFEEIIGCVAGDDTLLIVVNSNENTPPIVEKLRSYIE